MVLASVILLFLGIALQHWCTTAPLVFPHLAKNAEAYFEAQGRALSFSYEAGHVRGGYMASLLYDYNSQTYYIGLSSGTACSIAAGAAAAAWWALRPGK